uniref:Mitochondrial carrier protein n=1 Tax=Rhizochromulina marina TaxID=1034831 RepID=A0A7S2WKN1_9STRA|mmetsp:Transcript_26337/g.76792  ORF Transcript_26337/g.76792 Transcript_26337/m.76792 type:complete len:429 (+) Transcript_26337:43-1329(+)
MVMSGRGGARWWLWLCVLLGWLVSECVPEPADEEAEPSEAAAALSGHASTPESPLDIFKAAASKALSGGVTGACAGVLQVAGLMWLRTTMNFQYRHGGSIPQVMRALYREGGIPRFYQGLSFAIFQGPLARFGATAANEGMLFLVSSAGVSSGPGLALATAAASVVAGLWRLLIIPLDTLKTILQVEGAQGFRAVSDRVRAGQISSLYNGAYASAFATMVGHYPWFSTYNMLEKSLAVPATFAKKVWRSAFIGLTASVVSDLATNWIRVIKTTKQASVVNKDLSYGETLKLIVGVAGVKGLLFRGLSTRILANGLQSMLFTVFWRLLADNRRRRHRRPDQGVPPPPAGEMGLGRDGGGGDVGRKEEHRGGSSNMMRGSARTSKEWDGTHDRDRATHPDDGSGDAPSLRDLPTTPPRPPSLQGVSDGRG